MWAHSVFCQLCHANVFIFIGIKTGDKNRNGTENNDDDIALLWRDVKVAVIQQSCAVSRDASSALTPCSRFCFRRACSKIADAERRVPRVCVECFLPADVECSTAVPGTRQMVRVK